MRTPSQRINVQAHSMAGRVNLVLFVSLSLVALTASADEDSAHSQARKKTAPYYQDAQICRSRSKLDPLPEGADPAITIDASKFLSCINQMGYQQDAKTDPFLVAIQRCQAQRTKSVSASGEVAYKAPSQAQLRACLSTRGFPSAGAPPNPNASVSPLQGSSTGDSGIAKRNPPPTTSPESRQLQSVSPEDSQVETVVIPPRSR